jgi:hypothetical protein
MRALRACVHRSANFLHVCSSTLHGLSEYTLHFCVTSTPESGYIDKVATSKSHCFFYSFFTMRLTFTACRVKFRAGVAARVSAVRHALIGRGCGFPKVPLKRTPTKPSIQTPALSSFQVGTSGFRPSCVPAQPFGSPPPSLPCTTTTFPSSFFSSSSCISSRAFPHPAWTFTPICALLLPHSPPLPSTRQRYPRVLMLPLSSSQAAAPPPPPFPLPPRGHVSSRPSLLWCSQNQPSLFGLSALSCF